MKFTLRAMDAGAQGHQSSLYHTHSSSSSSIHSYSTEQTARERFPSENFAVGVRIGVGPETLRERAEMRETIQREIEKQRIREEILAEEMARKRILEEEVRNELRMERDMMSVRSGGGFSLPFMPLSLPPSHNHLLEPVNINRQPIGLEERIVTFLERKYANGSHHREIKGLEVPFQRFDDSPKLKGTPTPISENTKKEVIVLGKPDGKILCRTKRKSTPPVAACSSEVSSDSSKKKRKEEWSCAICQVSATSERGLNEHIKGKKHQSKEAALIAQKTGASFGLGVAHKKPIVKLGIKTINPSSLEKKSKTSSTIDSDNMKDEDSTNRENNRDKFKFWCEMCQVGAFSEKVMKNHEEGKKHLTNLVEHLQKGIESEPPVIEKTHDIEEKTETEKKEVVCDEVISVEGDKMSEKQKRDDFKFWCEMCGVGAFSETVMKHHKEGKRHLNNLIEVLQKRKAETEPPATQKMCGTEAKTTNVVVVVGKEPNTVIEEDEDEDEAKKMYRDVAEDSKIQASDWFNDV